jgi:DNA-directed RNA polymerase subunit RPC12/RpoP
MDIQHNGAAPEREDFSKIRTSIPIPNLIEVQKTSYERFLQMDLLPNEREDIGLQTVFNSVFPISDFRGVSDLEFVDYSIGNWECKCGNLKGLHHLRSTCRNCGATIRTDPFHAGDILCQHCGTFNKNVVTFCNKCGDPVGLQLKYDMLECQERGMTYAAPLKVTIRLTVYAKDPETQKKSVRDIKEQEVFFGEIPLMTDNGTFIINGTERVIVSQLHRSPGVFFERVPAQGYFLDRPETQILRFGIPPRPRLEDRRADPPRVLPRKPDYSQGQETALGRGRKPRRIEAFPCHLDQKRDDCGAGQEGHLFTVQGNPEGEDPACRSSSQRSRRRLRGRRRGRHVDRRSADRCQ